MTKSSKKGNKKMVLKILLIVLVVFVVMGLSIAIANKISIGKMTEYISNIENLSVENPVTVEKGSDGLYTITTDRDLKVMQLTDLHIGGGFMTQKDDKKVINTIVTMVKEEKPDVIIVTGDISYPVPFTAFTFNNRYAATICATLMEQLDVYWTPTFGNHDSEIYSIYNREKMADFYVDEKWENCLFLKGDENVDGFGNNVIKVKNSDGIITQALITIDSNDYPKENPFTGMIAGLTGDYDNIHENQIEWYKKACENLNSENKTIIGKNSDENKKAEASEKYGIVKSLVFMHIPPAEYAAAWDEFKANGYKDTDNVKYYYGTQGEKVCHSKTDDQFFETALEMKSTQGMFVGHDHINIYSVEYKGIRLTYGMSIDYVAYGDIDKVGTQRGCTIITVKPDGTFECHPENYYQDKYVNPDKEEVSMQQLNEEFN